MQPAAFIEWELAPATDQEGVLLPRRQVLSQYCTHTYRRWNGTAFVYGSCPYTGSQFFTEQGTSTNDPAKDKCSRRLDTGCIKRFGNNPLPTRAFPGVLQNRG
jgi:lambda family phage minor tail protein L